MGGSRWKDFYQGDAAVMAMDGPGERGGIAVIRSKQPARLLKIELGPLVEVGGHFTCAESGKAPVGPLVTIRMPGNFPIARCHSKGSAFSVRLPPGPYTFHGGETSDDYVEVQWNGTLKLGKRLDLGAIDLKLTPIARHYGKRPPPWHFTAARGVRKNVTIDDFRGKWLVLDFWFRSCEPCVGSSLPNWIDFCEEHAAHRNRFEILAIHDHGVTNLDGLDADPQADHQDDLARPAAAISNGPRWDGQNLRELRRPRLPDCGPGQSRGNPGTTPARAIRRAIPRRKAAPAPIRSSADRGPGRRTGLRRFRQ